MFFLEISNLSVYLEEKFYLFINFFWNFNIPVILKRCAYLFKTQTIFLTASLLFVNGFPSIPHADSVETLRRPAMSEATYTVSSNEELMDALARSTGGETIALESGDYGHLDFYGARHTFLQNYGSPVHLVAVDPDTPPIVTSFNVGEASNLTFDGFHFDYEAEPGAPVWEKPYTMTNVESIAITNSVFSGDIAESVGPTSDGYGAGFGLWMRGGKDIEVSDSTFGNFHRGAVFNDIDGLRVADNEMFGMSTDGMDFAATKHVEISGNYFHDFDKHPDNSAHMDMIQFWTAGTDEPSENVVIRNNFLNSRAGDETQSIFIRNQAIDVHDAGPDMLYRNFIIENNVIHNAHSHGITMSDFDGLTIRGNVLLQNADSASDGSVHVPAINTKGTAENLVIERNIVPREINIADSAVRPHLADNLVVQRDDPSGPNYVGDIFFDGLGGETVGLADLQLTASARSDPAVPDVGTGPLDVFAENLSAVFTIEKDPINDGAFAFDARATETFLSEDGTTNATYEWNVMGPDGAQFAQDEGVSTAFEFVEPGDYKIELTVQTDDGRTATNLTKVTVSDPKVFDLKVSQGGITDASSYGAELLVDEPEKVIAETDRGPALHVTDDRVMRIARDNPQVFAHDQISFAFEFKRAFADDGWGDIFRIHTALDIELDESGEMVFKLTNQDEESFTLRSEGAAITDTEWHHVVLTYDSRAEAATFYVDGENVGSATMQGITQPEESWGPEFGYSFGENFNGFIDQFEIRADVLTAQDVAERYAAFTGTTNPEASDIESDLPASAFELNFDDQADDIDADGAGLKFKDGAVHESTESNGFVSFDGETGRISLGQPDQFFDQEKLSVLLDVRVEEESGPVRLLWNHQQFGLEIRDDKLMFRSFDDQNNQSYTFTEALGVTDGNWHQVGFSLDTETGALQIFYDGNAVRTDELNGAHIGAKSYWDVLVGGAWGWSLDGDVDNIRAYEDILTASDAREIWESDMDGSLDASFASDESVVA